jgi:hypothetical protein
MIIIELANGQIVEEYQSIKEVKEMIEMNYINNKDYIDDDFTLFIEYKDGSTYYLHGQEIEEGTYKKTGIKTVLEDNGCCYSVYGNYKLVKVDDADDDINCQWLVEVA